MNNTQDIIKEETDKLNAALQTTEQPNSRVYLRIAGYTSKQIEDAYIITGSYTITTAPTAALLLEVSDGASV